MDKSTSNRLSPEALPPIVSRSDWEAARAELLVKEKEFTRARDRLNAERRRLPMVRIEKNYEFEGPEGRVDFIDLFSGRPQLLLYHFMFDPEWEEGCDGCSMVVDNMCHPAHLHARDIALVLVSLAPLAKLEAFKRRMSWSLPWYSSFGSDFNRDFGVTTPQGEDFGLSVFLRDGTDIYQTYFTNRRGVEYLGSSFSYIDLTPFGRQEDWEDTPHGRPKGPRYEWWRHHDRYDRDQRRMCCG